MLTPAVQGEFESEEDYLVYAKHPAHVEAITTAIKPVLATGGRAAVSTALPGYHVLVHSHL